MRNARFLNASFARGNYVRRTYPHNDGKVSFPTLNHLKYYRLSLNKHTLSRCFVFRHFTIPQQNRKLWKLWSTLCWLQSFQHKIQNQPNYWNFQNWTWSIPLGFEGSLLVIYFSIFSKHSCIAISPWFSSHIGICKTQIRKFVTELQAQ